MLIISYHDDVKVKLSHYKEIIKEYINNNIFISEYLPTETVDDIRRAYKPTFQYLNIDTWIVKGDKGYQIIWAGNGDWNAGWIDIFLQEFKFREYPDFKGGNENGHL